MVTLTWVVNILSSIVLICTIAATLVGFWNGRLQCWIRTALNIDSIEDNQQTMKEGIQQLREDHYEVRADLRTIKVAQLDMGEAINEGESINLDELETRHFGDDTRQGDFLRGGENASGDGG